MTLNPFVVFVNNATGLIDAFSKAKIKFNRSVDRSVCTVGDIALKVTLKRDTAFNECNIAGGGVDVNYCFRELGAKREAYAVVEGPAMYIHIEERPSEYVFFGYSTACNEVE